MSYSVNGSGHGADSEKVKVAFAEFVKALDEATDLEAPMPLGWSRPTLFQGNVAGSSPTGGFSLTAGEVREAAK